MHFKLDELEEYPEIRAIAQKLFISHLLMFLVTIINFVSCLIQGFAIEGEGIRILYTIVYFILFNNMQCYFFYTGYKSVIDEPEILTLPTTAIEQSNFTFGTACPVVFGLIVSISK